MYAYPTISPIIPLATGFCNGETTGFLTWMDTPVGTTQSLRCPENPAINITRTCSQSGVWESVDLSLCIPFTSINFVSASGISIETVTVFKYMLGLFQVYYKVTKPRIVFPRKELTYLVAIVSVPLTD